MHREAKWEAEQQRNALADANIGDNESVDAQECWICRDTGTLDDPLITDVCLCRGSIAWVHQKCIDQWVFTQRRVNCPSCDAEYNVISSNCAVAPETLVGGVLLLIRKLAIPILYKILLLVLAIVMNIFAVPGVIGAAHYHQDVFRSGMNPYNKMTTNLLDDPVPNGGMGSVGSSVSPSGVGSNTSADKLEGFWLWATVLLYGWVNLALWCSMRSAWRQWRVFCNRLPNPIDPALPPPFTSVEYLHWVLDVCQRTMACSLEALSRRIVELFFLTPLAYVLSFPEGKAAVVVCLGIIALLWRLRFPRKRIRDPMRRFMEAQERKADASDVDIALWFGTYVSETLLFSILLPICAGIVLRFSVSPFLLPMPESIIGFITQLSLFQLLGYWLMGSTCSLILMQVESRFVVPLFAPGVDLFFIRSVDLNIEGGSVYWSFIVAQVFDADPLRVIVDFLRLSCIELTSLYLFVAAPLCVTFALHSIINTPGTLPAPQAEQRFFGGDWGFDLFFASFDLHNINFVGQNAFVSVWRAVCWICKNRTLQWWSEGALTVIGFGTVVMCLRMFPIQFMQLRVMRPLAMWLSNKIFHIDAFLFDAERLEVLDRWLRGNGLGELNMPEIPLTMIFSRRERGMAPEDLPKYFIVRHVFFSVFFFLLGSALFWVGPVIAMEVVLFFLPGGVSAICVSLNLFFLLLNPTTYVAAMEEFILLCFIVIVSILVQPVLLCVPLFKISREQLVKETMEYTLDVKRTVGIYRMTT